MFVEHRRAVPRKAIVALVAQPFCLINILFLFLKLPTFRTLLLHRLKLLNCHNAASFRTFIQ